MITADQLKDVMERAEALRKYLDIDKKKIELKEPIKVLGVRTIEARLFEGVVGKIKINVIII